MWLLVGALWLSPVEPPMTVFEIVLVLLVVSAIAIRGAAHSPPARRANALS